MFTAHESELRLALLSLFSVAAEIPEIKAGLCRVALDQATASAYRATPGVIALTGAENPTAVRFGAARVLNGLCAACRACPRGMDPERAALTAEAPS